MPWPILFDRTYAICRLLVISYECMQLLLFFSLHFKKHDRHSYLFSVYLPIQCILPYFTQKTYTHTFTFKNKTGIKQQKKNLNRRSTIKDQIVSLSFCSFFPICNQTITIVFSLFFLLRSNHLSRQKCLYVRSLI